MKKILFVFIIALSLSSCGTPYKQLNLECEVPVEELFMEIAVKLEQHRFEIKRYQPEYGYLLAEYYHKHLSLYGEILIKNRPEMNVWEFRYKDGKIVATAKEVRHQYHWSGGVYRSWENYYDDDYVDREPGEGKNLLDIGDESWYWNIRYELEKLCKNKIVFTYE